MNRTFFSRLCSFIFLLLISCQEEDEPGTQNNPHDENPYGIKLSTKSMTNDYELKVLTFVDNKIFFHRHKYESSLNLYDPLSSKFYTIETPAEAGEFTNEGGYHEIHRIKDKYYLSYNHRGIHPPYTHKLHIYDLKTEQWNLVYFADEGESLTLLSSAVVGEKIYYACIGSPQINHTILKVYDPVTNGFETIDMPENKALFSTLVVNNEILFAGGVDISDEENYKSSINIFNSETKQWRTVNLSEPKARIAAVAVDGKAFFAGGNRGDLMSDKLEIYDVTANTWTYKTLSDKKHSAGITHSRNKVFVAGGHSRYGDYNGGYSSIIDIFDLSNDERKVMALSNRRGYLLGGSIDNNVYFAGGKSDAGFTRSTNTMLDILTIP